MGDAGRQAYIDFRLGLDIVWAFAYTAFLATITGACLKRTSHKGNLILLTLVPGASDLIENFLAIFIVGQSQCGFRAGRSTTDMIFSVRQLQEKCQEQNQPLYLAFIDLMKAFNVVSRNGLFHLLKKIGCPPKLHSIIELFHTDIRSTVSYNGATSDPFPIISKVKQGCVLAPTLFGIFFSLLLSHAFSVNEDRVYLHTRSNGRLFNLARLCAKTKVRHVTIREALFADDAALATHTQEALQRLLDRFSHACKEFGLTLSIKKTA